MEIKIIVKTTKIFDKWFKDLKDIQAVTAIRVRISRIKNGNFGDIKHVKGVKGIYELRIHVGNGYRIYCSRDGNMLVILLNGGNKSTQKNDIEKAEILKESL
ncbi:MAG: type II toxin-antitoxin system RelE/ParE family toxin [Endomicrobium sp.]|jgi:putative addiction module killer protein|nr:type II toxin-antitoxin system RelE/ParE family toxin [Endomicrobium sp.]